MAASTVATAPAPEASSPAAPDLAQLAALLQDLTGKVAALTSQNSALQTQLAETRQATPKVMRRQAEDPHNTAARRANAGEVLAGLQKGTAASGAEQIPVTRDGQRIPTELLERFGPKYQAGDAVRLRLDVVREGFPWLLDGKHVSKDTVLAAEEQAKAEGTPAPKVAQADWGYFVRRYAAEAVGTVLRSLYHTKLPENYKYVVHFRGLGRKEHGDGFYDYELEPA